MKKLLSVLLAFLLIIGCVSIGGCGQTSSKGYLDDEDYDENYDDEEDYDDYDDDSFVDEEIKYISDRKVDYYEKYEKWTVFFAFENSDEVRIAGSGTAHIKITDNKGTQLYKKDIAFDKDDFSTWTSGLYPEGRYMCGLDIAQKSVSKGYSTSGTLYLSITLTDGTTFNEMKLSISDLQTAEAKIKLPSLPVTYSYYGYSDDVQSKARIDKITYQSSISYDGSMDVNFQVLMTCVYDKDNTAAANQVGYRIKDSKGVVVDSGHIYSNPISVGESSYEGFRVYNLNPAETYTLSLTNAT